MSLESLVSGMTELANLDPRQAVWGAATHGWQGEAADPAALSALEAAGVKLPEPWRRWVSELVGVGAGPFKGTLPPPDASATARLTSPFEPASVPSGGALPGFLPVSNLPERVQAGAIVAGPHTGEVWVDLRAAGQGVERVAADFGAFVAGWLEIARVQWAIAYGSDGIPTDAPATFVEAVRRAVENAAEQIEGRSDAAGSDAGRLARFGPGPHEVMFLRGRFQLIDGDVTGAEASFMRSAFTAPADSAVPALGRCALAAYQGDVGAWLQAATDGLNVFGLSWLDRKRMLGQQALALEASERFAEALDAHIAMCEHDPKDLRAWLTVAYLTCHFGEFDRAVAWLRRVLDLETGLDESLSLREKMGEAAATVLSALREEGYEEDAASLEEAIERYLLTAELWG